MATGTLPVDQQVEHVAERLVHDFADEVDGNVVRSLVTQEYAGYSHARVQQFVPVLVDRSVRQRLRAH